LLARVRTFGFTVHDDGKDTIEVEREGRTSTIDLVSSVRYEGSDARDLWLLSLALEDGTQWAARETYFSLRLYDNEPMPVVMTLSDRGPGRPMVLRHGLFSNESESHAIGNTSDLLDALPFIAASNTIGYHRARERIIASYERLRPKTWAEVGVTDAGVIAEYERHSVRAEDVVRAAESGIVGMNRIISVFGMPASDEWSDVR